MPKDTPPVTHLGIDETRRGKAKFRLVEAPDGGEIWEVVADRWHVGLVDLVGGAGLPGQVEGRTAASVSAWIGAQTRQWRAGVQVVAIDMCTVFKAAVRDSLPHVSTWWPQILARSRPASPTPPPKGSTGRSNRRRAPLRDRVVSQVSPNPDPDA
jgi:hypothetical protein